MNDQLGLNPFDVPAIIQEKKKYASFTVREIGGPLEIIEWRKKQAEKEALNQTIRMQLVEKQKVTMFGEDAPQGDQVTWKGHASAQAALGSWHDKLEHVKNERERLAKLDDVEPFEYVPLVKAIPTLGQRIKKFIAGIWNSAQEK